MFIENKYSRIYLRMMEKARSREPLEEGEWHHVIPRSCGGDNSNGNIVRLSYREHFIAHALLTKMMIDDNHKKSMAYAFVSMSNRRGNRVNSRLYEVIKRQILPHFQGSNNNFYGKGHLHSGEKNPFYGKTHDRAMIERTRIKLSVLLSGEKNPFYGKTHSERTRRIISEKRTIPINVKFVDGSTRCFYRREELGVYLGVSRSMGAQLAKPSHVVGSKSHLWEKYGIEQVVYMTGEEYEASQHQKV